jgi:hypothetical protein
LTSAQPVGLNYWKYLSDVLQPEPIEARDKVMLGMLVSLGIEKGKPFNPTDRQKKILTEAAQVGELMARTNAFDKRARPSRRRRRIGSRPFPARAGSRTFGSMGRKRPTSTNHGSSMTSNRWTQQRLPSAK